MLNRAVLTGRLTKDPEVQYTANGTPVLSFTLAVDRQFRNKQGDRDADFINCVIWRKSAENFANFTHKGALVGIDGRIQTRNYENNQGQRVYVTEVVVDNFALLEPRRQGGNGGGQYNGGQNQYGGGNGSYSGGRGNNGYGNGQGQNNGYGNNNNYGGYQNNSHQGNNNGGAVEINDDSLPFNTNSQPAQSAPQQNNSSSNPSNDLTADQLPTGGSKPSGNDDEKKKSDNLTNSEDDLPF